MVRHCSNRSAGISFDDDAPELFDFRNAILERIRGWSDGYDAYIGMALGEDPDDQPQVILSDSVFDFEEISTVVPRVTVLNRSRHSFESAWSIEWDPTRESEAWKVARNNRRAKKFGSDHSLSIADWLSIAEAFGFCCAYCGATSNIVIDHVIPVRRGGPTNRKNVVPACFGCNSKKRCMSIVEFAGEEESDRIMSILNGAAK